MTFGEKVHSFHIEPRLLSARLQYFKPKIITGNVTKAETNISFGLKFQIGEGILVCQIKMVVFFAAFVALSEYMNFTRQLATGRYTTGFKSTQKQQRNTRAQTTYLQLQECTTR